MVVGFRNDALPRKDKQHRKEQEKAEAPASNVRMAPINSRIAARPCRAIEAPTSGGGRSLPFSADLALIAH
jgi:hypothetical protein